MKSDKFKQIEDIVRQELSCSAHDFDHTIRVYNLAVKLAKGEKVDLEVIRAATLLHDIARIKEDDDPTGHIDHAVLSAEMAKPILKKFGFTDNKIKHIQDCIISHRYKTDNRPKTKEAEILFDADKLEGTGAIGTARKFVWVGRNGANIYKKVNIKQYIQENMGSKRTGRIHDNTKHSPQIEFEVKTKYLCDSLFTKKAKRICKERTNFMKKFLDRLEREMRGEI
jgi:uncharacterized protein